MQRRHVIISGTGRAGTTFLVQLLTNLGLDTGFASDTGAVLPAAKSARMGPLDRYPIARAGLEMDIRAAGAPYIIKTPFLCDYIQDVLAAGTRIEHAIIPVRSFEAASASRAQVQLVTTGSSRRTMDVPGGLWEADNVEEQIDVLRRKFTNLIEALVYHDVPMTFLSFPRHVRDPNYLYGKLRFLMRDVDPISFRSAFNAVARPELIHQFTEADR